MEEREADTICEWIQWMTLFWDGERGGIPPNKRIKMSFGRELVGFHEELGSLVQWVVMAGY